MVITSTKVSITIVMIVFYNLMIVATISCLSVAQASEIKVNAFSAAPGHYDMNGLKQLYANRLSLWEEAVTEIEDRYRHSNTVYNRGGMVVFIGASSVRRWSTLTKSFSSLPIVNAGFGGSRVIDSALFVDRLITPFSPETIFFLAGTNDIVGGVTPAQILENLKVFVNEVHRALPRTHIVLISIPPNIRYWSLQSAVVEANDLINQYALTDHRLHFVDIHSRMLGENGKPIQHLYTDDDLHVNELGYDLWEDLLAPYMSYPFQKVQLELDCDCVIDQSGAFASPFNIRVKIAPELIPADVQVMVNNDLLYEGMSGSEVSLKTSILSDGLYDLALRIVDKNKDLWERHSRVNTKHVKIIRPPHGARIRGYLDIEISTAYDSDDVAGMRVTLTPLLQGDSVQDERVVIYDGEMIPDQITADTLLFPDGTYDMAVDVVTAGGQKARDSHPIIVRKWDGFTDRFVSPTTNPWFGVRDHKLTVFESPGWNYMTDESELFFGDDSRRIWSGKGSGYLIWEVPALERLSGILYTRNSVDVDVRLEVSSDGKSWTLISFDTEKARSSENGWSELKFFGSIVGTENIRFVRLTAGEEAMGDNVQIGEISFLHLITEP